ncbi:MAG: hypothetical protein FWC64_02700 [Treponema sp.]|nr:hypothetical protein [Treponema sp.]
MKGMHRMKTNKDYQIALNRALSWFDVETQKAVKLAHRDNLVIIFENDSEISGKTTLARLLRSLGIAAYSPEQFKVIKLKRQEPLDGMYVCSVCTRADNCPDYNKSMSVCAKFE